MVLGCFSLGLSLVEFGLVSSDLGRFVSVFSHHFVTLINSGIVTLVVLVWFVCFSG